MMKNDNNNGDVVDQTGSNNRLSRWHHNSSRIIRVSRASGGKDRHSKVWTSKGARDRRVRLSVSTALQFYDLQDRLGYDQPSKAVEWLIKAAEDSISELPSLNNTNFPTDEDENRGENQLTGIGLVKPACSSNSDTSKNSSGLSLSRSELRDKARERARERTAKERESSFTDLLNSGSVNVNRNWMVNNPPPVPSTTSSSLEYFTSGLILGSGQQQQTHFPVQSNFTNHHQEFSFVPDHQMIPQGGSNGGFNLDFNMSSSSGFNRGTLQSNSTSHHQSFLANLQRFPTSEGGSAQFLFGETHGNSNGNNNINNNHQFQLYYENGNSDQKGKGKN